MTSLMTEEEFLLLPETKLKVELFDGEVVREDSPSADHQGIVGELFFALEEAARARTPPAQVWLSPLDVRFAAQRILQPDLLVYRTPLVRPIKMPLTTVPDLCIEVVSTNRLYDRVTKRLAYAQAGVAEYWTVMKSERMVERWTGQNLATREELRDRLTTPMLPSLSVDIVALLA
jgi:Uma2 family endonuclease